MSVALLGLNVLIALAWPSHVHDAPAHEWFARRAADGWATCPVTQRGFVRVSSNPTFIRDAVAPKQALRGLREIVAYPHHVFWPDDIPVSDPGFPDAYVLGHRQLTDAYLLGLAIRMGGRLATLDGSLSSLLPPRDPRQNAIELIVAW